MLKIRLMRIGAKQKPFYRIVVMDERNKRDGAYLDLLGTYNPLTEPKDIKLDKVKLAEWLKKGAQKSDGLLRMLKEAPQRPPRKPKKEKKVEEAAPAAQPVAEQPAEQETPPAETVPEPSVPTDETPAEENPSKIATEPEAPRNDEVKESEKKDEGSA